MTSRRSFLAKAIATLAVTPVLLSSNDGRVPPEAGRVQSVMLSQDILILACENGVWISRKPFDKCERMLQHAIYYK